MGRLGRGSVAHHCFPPLITHHLFCLPWFPTPFFDPQATTVGGSIFNGMNAGSEPLQLVAGETLDSRVEGTMADVYDEIKNTAKEFNTRGDLNAGANIAAFLKVADVMLAHGSV